MIRDAFPVACAACLLVAPAAVAKTVTVTVDAKAGPWSVKLNPKMPYGNGDEAPSAVVKGLEPESGKVEIYPDGKITVAGKQFDSVGDSDKEVDDRTGKKKKRFPSFYTPKILYPAYAHGLVATFINDAGVIVGRPIMVGEGIRVAIPADATGISLGLNDDIFADNSGSLTVKLELPED